MNYPVTDSRELTLYLLARVIEEACRLAEMPRWTWDDEYDAQRIERRLAAHGIHVDWVLTPVSGGLSSL